MARMTVHGTMVVWLVLGALGCGSSSTSATGAGAVAQGSGAEAAAHEHHEHGEGGHHAHGLPPGPVADFHGVLRPLWHSEPGPERDARTCAQAGALRTHAGAIVAAPVPESARAHEAEYRAAATALNGEVDALVTACGATDRAGVADRLAAVHTAFHRLMEQMELRH